MISGVMVLLVMHAILFGSCWVIGLIVFGPLYERTLLFQPSARFRISDLMILALYVQVIAALVVTGSRSGPSLEGAEVAFVMGDCLLFATFIWFNGLRMLGRGGVNNTWHRWIFLGVLLPLGYLSGFLALVSLFSLPYAVITALAERDAVWALVSCVLLGAWPTAILVYRISQTYASAARHDRAASDGIQFISEISSSAASIGPRRHIPYSTTTPPRTESDDADP